MAWIFVVIGIVAAIALIVGVVLYFRSFRRWGQPAQDQSSEAQQAEMYLDAESHLTDRF